MNLVFSLNQDNETDCRRTDASRVEGRRISPEKEVWNREELVDKERDGKGRELSLEEARGMRKGPAHSGSRSGLGRQWEEGEEAYFLERIHPLEVLVAE